VQKIVKFSDTPFFDVQKNCLSAQQPPCFARFGQLSILPTPNFGMFKKIAFQPSSHLALQSLGNCQFFRHPFFYSSVAIPLPPNQANQPKAQQQKGYRPPQDGNNS